MSVDSNEQLSMVARRNTVEGHYVKENKRSKILNLKISSDVKLGRRCQLCL